MTRSGGPTRSQSVYFYGPMRLDVAPWVAPTEPTDHAYPPYRDGAIVGYWDPHPVGCRCTDCIGLPPPGTDDAYDFSGALPVRDVRPVRTRRAIALGRKQA